MGSDGDFCLNCHRTVACQNRQYQDKGTKEKREELLTLDIIMKPWRTTNNYR